MDLRTVPGERADPADPADPVLEAAMARAVALAERGLGTTSPNPVVGCVLLAPSGEVVGEGWHERPGGPHAEVVALRAAGEAARGGTAVVTLEPCSHTGRTGPCTEALLAAGVARVAYAVPDPNPSAAGGAERLSAAGVEVVGGVLAQAAERVNEAWLTSAWLGRPHVTWKYAATLDGRAAAADGSSRWITSPESRADVHLLRARADAVVVGSGTLLADDPHLAARHPGAARQPVRVVLDTAARLRPGARVLDGAAPTIVLVAAEADTAALDAVVAEASLPAAGAAGSMVQVIRVPRAPDGRGLDLTRVLAALHERGIRSVLLEGGPTLAGAFLAAGLVDTVVAYLAPALLGEGPGVLGPSAIHTIGDAVRLRIDDITRLGPDLRVVARRQTKED